MAQGQNDNPRTEVKPRTKLHPKDETHYRNEAAMRLILASKSPRRRELLEMIGMPFEVITKDVDERRIEREVRSGEHLKESDVLFDSVFSRIVFELALEKADAVFQTLSAADAKDAIVIGCDTIVVLGDAVFCKPKDKADAKRMLIELSGKTHQVYTTAVLLRADEFAYVSQVTDVTFQPLDDFQESCIERYVASGSPLDKAGAYGIQDEGALLVEKIEGDYYTVMGLPLAALAREIENMVTRC